MRTDSADMTCRNLTELVTEYWQGALPPAERVRFERHLTLCPGCQAYFDQMRHVIDTLGSMREEPLPAEIKQPLLQLFRSRFPTRTKPLERNTRLGIGEEYVSAGDHIGYFWESDQDFAEAVKFLEVGLRAEDYCFVFGHDEANQKVLALLARRGFNVERLLAQGRLAVVGGDPSGERLLANIGAAFQVATAHGAPLIRLLGNIGWGRQNWPHENAILEFEARVTDAARQFPCVVVCMYDVHALPGRIIFKGGFETHPLTLHGQVLRENPHHVPTELFLNRLRAESKLGTIQ